MSLVALLLLVLPLLGACATLAGNDPEPLLMTRRGEVPTVCYVRARSFAGFVPVSCIEAAMIRP